MIVKRPLVWISAALVGGTAFSSAFWPPFVPLLIAFVSTFALAVVFIIAKKRAPAAFAALAASFLIGACAYLLEAHSRETPDQLATHYASDTSVKAVLHGMVRERSISRDSSSAKFVLDVERIETEVDGIPISTEAVGRTRVSWYAPGVAVEPGDLVRVAGKLKLLRGFKNPRIFDYERYMHRRGIFSTLYAKGSDAAKIEGRGKLSLPRRLREHFRREGLRIIARATQTGETRAFVSAILLGERGLLTEEMEQWFKKTGTFHILAISGLHVGLVYLIVSLALTPLPLGARGRVALSLAIVWIYAFATGGSVSVTRASIMLTLVLTAFYFSREGDFLTSLAAAALILAGINPIIIDDLGFQLSFSAVLLLCTFEPFYTRNFYPLVQGALKRLPAPVVSRLAVTLFASLAIGVGMLPLVAYHFNTASFIFPLANLFVIPVLSLVLAAGFACLLAGFVWIEFAVVFGLIVEMFSWAIFGVVKLCSLVPGGSTRVASPPLWVLGLEALAIALIWWRPLSIRKLASFAAIAVFAGAVLLSGRPPADTMRMTFLDVGDADACFIEFASGETMLVDTGFATRGLDCGEDLIAPFLWKKGLSTIDALVLTHPDADHTGGAVFLIENFRIGRLWIPDVDGEAPGFAKILAAVEEKDCPIERLDASDSPGEMGGTHIEVLNPPVGIAFGEVSDNDLSLVLRLTYDETSLLLGGDAGKNAFRSMIDSGKDLESDILKAPHHGLESGFNRKFVKLVRPLFVVISGKTHRIDRGMERRVGRYAPLCEKVMSTQDSGAVTVESDGHEISIESTRKRRGELF